MNNPDRNNARYPAGIYAGGFLAIAIAFFLGFAVWVAKDPNACPPTADDGSCATLPWIGLAFVPFAILLIGSFGAVIQTFRLYRRGGEYQQWHIVTWLLLVAMTMYAGISAFAMAGAA